MLSPDLSELIRNTFLENSNPEEYLFGKAEPLNSDYFKLVFRRCKLNSVLNLQGKTIYSLRHAADIQVLKRTNELHLVQRLLGHSDIQVTIIYLRTLGEFNEPIRQSDLRKI